MKKSSCKRCNQEMFIKSTWQKFCTPYCQATYWKETHLERTRENQRRYNAREDVKIMKRLWKEKKAFDGNETLLGKKCHLCQINEDLVIHHIDGNNGRHGKLLNNSSDNLMVLCRKCHPTVHNRWWRKEISSENCNSR